MSNVNIKKIIKIKYDLPVGSNYLYLSHRFDPSKLNIIEKDAPSKCYIINRNYSNKANLLNSMINKKYIFSGNLDNIKTYYFVPNTKFDREYFKRLYPDLKYTRIVKNADIVIYDDNSYRNNFLQKLINTEIGPRQYAYVFNKNFYAISDYPTLYMLKTSKNTDYTDIVIKGTSAYNLLFANNEDRPEFHGKMIHIDKLFDSMKSDLLSDNLDTESAITYLKQIMSKNIGAQKAAIEALLSYSNFNLTKSILLSFATSSSSLKSAKYDFHIKKHEVFEPHWPIFLFIETVSHDINNKKYSDEKDKNLAIQIINSQTFQSHWAKNTKIPFKLEFFSEEKNKKSGAPSSSNIAEFVV